MTSQPLIVTLDGPAGVGKTTLAKRVAAHLGVAFLDTGAMFRAVAYKLGEGAWECADEMLCDNLAAIVFSLRGTGAETELLADGEPLGEGIRTEKVGLWASNLATRSVIRAFLKKAQQELGARNSLVCEGRDMGTVVFPDAPYKFFLDASPEERARRRYRQLKEQGQSADLDQITLQLRIRDAQDRNRPLAPLKPADDAQVIDTTERDVDEVFKAIVSGIKE